jgi:NitT/TauT family transport system substrate-binding protein
MSGTIITRNAGQNIIHNPSPQPERQSLNRNIGIVIVLAAVLILAIAAGYFLLAPPGLPAPPVPLSIGLQPNEAKALIYVAEDRNFFAKNGLQVTVRDYEPAATGVSAMLDGKVDIAGSSEFPVVTNILDGKTMSIICTDDRFLSISLIGRKDRGIEKISDLKGKKIGIARGTINEFYLGRLLSLNGLGLKDVSLVDVRPAQFSDSIATGKTDAVICTQPYASEIAGRMGDAVGVWPAQSSQPMYGIFVARTDWVANNPEQVVRFLRSMDMAAQYTAANPAAAQEIVKKRLNLSTAYMDSRWSQNRFSLSLDQSLVLAMEDEARWMMANNLTNATAVPDFRQHIYTDGMEAVKPGSVNIIG